MFFYLKGIIQLSLFHLVEVLRSTIWYFRFKSYGACMPKEPHTFIWTKKWTRIFSKVHLTPTVPRLFSIKNHSKLSFLLQRAKSFINCFFCIFKILYKTSIKNAWEKFQKTLTMWIARYLHLKWRKQVFCSLFD